MDTTTQTLISLGSAVVSLASFFGLFYKMKYQIEQLEKKQDKHNDLIERMYAVEKTTAIIQEQLKEMEEKVDERQQLRYGGNKIPEG